MKKFFINSDFLFFLVPYILLYFFTVHNALFWDTVQFGSDHPQWYYNNGFKYFFLPDSIDSGHPPAFGMYLALVWMILGKSIWVSHTAMLPFVCIIVAQSVKLGKNLFPENKKHAFLCTAIILSEAVLLSQCTLVSPDICVAAFFLLAWNAILKHNTTSLILAVVFMGIVSTRAMMGAFCLYIFSLSYNSTGITRNFSLKGIFGYFFKIAIPFIPGGLLGIAFLLAHYLHKGWAGHPPISSPWGGGFVVMPFPRIIVNIGILFWRIIDIGKILTFGVFVFFTVRWLCKKVFIPGSSRKTIQSLFVLVIALFLITALPLTPYQGLLTHRYFLPLYFSISIFGLYLLLNSNFRYKHSLAILMILVQLSGHFWNYPRRVSQGWDSTLGHLPFYSLRKEFKIFMEQNGIRKKDVATSFTLYQSDSRLDLEGDTISYKQFDRDTTQYVWYCNASNAMNKIVGYYFDHFEIVKKKKRGNVEMVLFRRREKGI